MKILWLAEKEKRKLKRDSKKSGMEIVLLKGWLLMHKLTFQPFFLKVILM
jgi:hypothetical protein